uniref:Family with sequence similarity 83 member C n=1 Tax=Salarias fasciatus TaxID=181472 RepID=A0A672G904_SALFA
MPGLRPAAGGRKPLGKLASRLEEVKNPWRQGSALELSHSEAARLATDALLEHGEAEYRRVLSEERELNFLSPLEIRYIGQHAASRGGGPDPGAGAGAERDFGDGDAVSELTSGTYFPMMSDEEPPMLELGWPDGKARYGPSETQIYFQRDKSHNIKDLIRSLINKASKVIAVVMDVFTDVDLLCDLMEASNKRRVPVYILLDQKNLEHFTDMCSALDIHHSHLSNMRVRSVCGDTYCTKSGKKFSGQVLEKFMIIDCEEVIAGSYSFTWLSAQVHSNMVMHFSGRVVDSFDREFRCLYADSLLIDAFCNPEEEGLPFYPPYPAMMAPGPGLGLGFGSRTGSRRRNSSSQSSSSVSSVKAAPGMTSGAVYKVAQGHDKKESSGTPRPSPDRRGGGGDRDRDRSRPPPSYSPAAASVGGASSKFQALGLYDHKPGMFHGSALHPAGPAPGGADGKLSYRQRTPSNQLFTKLSDLFLPPAPKDKAPPPLAPDASPWGGPDLSQPEPESEQSPPPPPSPAAVMTRQDQKRMTLGHSKLDLVSQYNRMKSRQVYSRFELKSSN